MRHFQTNLITTTILEDRIEYALQSPGNPLSDLTSVDFVLSAASATSGIRIFPMLIIGCYEMPGSWINISDNHRSNNIYTFGMSYIRKRCPFLGW